MISNHKNAASDVKIYLREFKQPSDNHHCIVSLFASLYFCLFICFSCLFVFVVEVCEVRSILMISIQDDSIVPECQRFLNLNKNGNVQVQT